MSPRESRLLFVCTGNLCRSPMAAALADRVTLELGIEAEIRSAGTHAEAGAPAHPQVVAVCRELGLELDAHEAVRLDEPLVRWADRILVMEPAHAVAVRALVNELPDAAITHLGPLVGKAAIDDPIGSWFRSSYRATRDDLLAAIRRALR